MTDKEKIKVLNAENKKLQDGILSVLKKNMVLERETHLANEALKELKDEKGLSLTKTEAKHSMGELRSSLVTEKIVSSMRGKEARDARNAIKEARISKKKHNPYPPITTKTNIQAIIKNVASKPNIRPKLRKLIEYLIADEFKIEPRGELKGFFDWCDEQLGLDAGKMYSNYLSLPSKEKERLKARLAKNYEKRLKAKK